VILDVGPSANSNAVSRIRIKRDQRPVSPGQHSLRAAYTEGYRKSYAYHAVDEGSRRDHTDEESSSVMPRLVLVTSSRLLSLLLRLADLLPLPGTPSGITVNVGAQPKSANWEFLPSGDRLKVKVHAATDWPVSLSVTW